MSWYVNFYIGIMDADGKIIPLGPYDNKGELKCVRSTSRSFTTDLHEKFDVIKPEQFTDELRKEFEYYTSDDCELAQYFGYLPLNKLPKGDYIKRGYFLNEDIYSYMKDGDPEFYESLTPEEYAFRLESELKFGAPKMKKDEYGFEYCEHSCSEYSYFCYPDYCCEEYEAWVLRHEANLLMDIWEVLEGSEIVVIKTEG